MNDICNIIEYNALVVILELLTLEHEYLSCI